MAEKLFRNLKADEIDCRIQSIKQSGLVLLLYKDARCDQNILDEAIGPMNWQRHHTRDNANCIVSIYDDAKKAWIEKEDTGTKSFTEEEKGLASDSFKRACFNWGIGRELYTAPFIWISSSLANIVNVANKEKKEKDKFVCHDSFSVKEISYNEKNEISLLKIVNNKGIEVFSFINENSGTAYKRLSNAKNKRELRELYKNLPDSLKNELKASITALADGLPE